MWLHGFVGKERERRTKGKRSVTIFGASFFPSRGAFRSDKSSSRNGRRCQTVPNLHSVIAGKKKTVGMEMKNSRKNICANGKNTSSIDLEAHVDLSGKVISALLVRLRGLFDFVLVLAVGADEHARVARIRHTERLGEICAAFAAVEAVQVVVLLPDELVEQIPGRLLADRADFWCGKRKSAWMPVRNRETRAEHTLVGGTGALAFSFAAAVGEAVMGGWEKISL